MSNTVGESIVDALLSLVEGPAGIVAKMGKKHLVSKLFEWRDKEKTKGQLLAATQLAEQSFIAIHENHNLAQAVASFPLGRHPIFLHALEHLTEHLNERFLSDQLDRNIAEEWPLEFDAKDIHEGVAFYLECLRIQLLKVEDYREIVIGLRVLNTDKRAERIEEIVGRLEKLLVSFFEREIDYSKTIGATTNPTIAPLPPTTYIPREELLKQIKNSLGLNDGEGQGHTVAITALLGIGGVGKTVLAQAIATDENFKKTYSDGLLWVSLGPDVHDETGADPYLADWLLALGCDPRRYPSPIAKTDAIRAVLGEQKRLIVIDDIWYREAAVLFHDARGAGCSVLMTSRDREVMARLGVSNDCRIDVDALTKDEARALVEKILGDFGDWDWEEQIFPVIERLGGHAMAVRLAAFQVSLKDITWVQILSALIEVQGAEKIDFLDSDSREESLMVTFNLSTDFLTEEQRRYFAWLGVLVPGEFFYLDDASFLWTKLQKDSYSGDKVGIKAMIEESKMILHLFNRRGLLEIESTPIEEQVRYRLHLLLWEHAHRLLRERYDELEHAAQHHANVYHSIILQDDHLQSTRHNIDITRPQWNAIFQRAWRTINKEEGFKYSEIGFSRSLLSSLVRNLEEYFHMRGLYHDWLSWIQRSLEISREIGDRRCEVADLGILGLAWAALGEVRKAIEYHGQALEISREIGDRRSEGTNLGNRGNAWAFLG